MDRSTAAVPRDDRLAELEALVARLDRENLRLRQALADATSDGASGDRARLQLEEERRIFVSGPVVVFKWRNAAGWPVEYVSPNVVGLFGHRAEAFLAGEVLYADLIHPDDLERVGREVGDASESDRSHFEHEPYRIRDKSGRTLWLHDSTTILRDAEGRASHYLGYVFDISDRIAAEQSRLGLETRMLQAQKLESLGVLAGGIAHDFNNLLTSILGNAELAGGAAPESRPDHLQAIVTAAQRAAELCSQMLAYAGRGRFDVASVDLNAVVLEMGELLGVSVAKGVRLVHELAADLPPVRVDPSQLRQVLMNLILNASESIESGSGQVTVSTAQDDSAAGDGGVRLTIEDDGCGMDAATVARIFDPFYTTKFTGRGLGLAAVQGIVGRLRGRIEVDSEPGRGTRFDVFLPVECPADEADDAGPPAVLAPRRFTGRVLLIEDEEAVRDVAGQLLRSLGFEVLTAVDGQDGVETLARHRDEVDLVVLDITMPRMSGEQALPRLRALRPDLPVLVASGYDADDVLERLARDHVVEFVHKPYTAEQLARCLARLVQPEG